MRITSKVVATMAAAGTLFATTAQAQGTFNYFTTGQFSYSGSSEYCNTPTPPTTAGSTAFTTYCGSGAPGTMLPGTSTPSFGLQFIGAQPFDGTGFGSGSQISYGYFQPYGTGGASTATLPGSVMFKLFINQVSPTTGQASVAGSFSGTLRTTPDSYSDLFWTPDSTSVNIDNVTYTLDRVSEGCDAPLDNLHIGAAPNQTSINGCAVVHAVTTTPEPSSMALIGTGLIGLVPVLRRKNKK